MVEVYQKDLQLPACHVELLPFLFKDKTNRNMYILSNQIIGFKQVYVCKETVSLKLKLIYAI